MPLHRTMLLLLMLTMLLGSTGCCWLTQCNRLPTAELTNARITYADFEKARLQLTMKVNNNYRVAIPLTALEFDLRVDDRPLLSGAVPQSVSIPANGSRTIRFPVEMAYEDILELLDSSRLGTLVSYEVNLLLRTDAGLLGVHELPIQFSGELPIPKPLVLSYKDAELTSVTLTRLRGKVRMSVMNPNEFPAALDELQWKVHLNGPEIADGTVSLSRTLAPKSTRDVSLSLSVRPLAFAQAVVDAVLGLRAELALRGNLRGALGPVPLNQKFEFQEEVRLQQ